MCLKASGGKGVPKEQRMLVVQNYLSQGETEALKRDLNNQNAGENELTSFFKVWTKQSSVFLYAESPIILDFTCKTT